MLANDLFQEYDSDILCVKDFELKYQGSLISHITKDDDGQVEFWSGEPSDKFSEQILLDEKTEREYIDYIEDML